MRCAAICTTLAVLLVVPSAAIAQWGPPAPPKNAFQVRFGHFWLDPGDDGFWADTESVFTLDSSDFRGFSFGGTFVHSIRNWFELGFNLDLFDTTVRSSYRDFVDENGRSILHDSKLSLVPTTVDVRFFPLGRYRVRPGGRNIVQTTFYFGLGVGWVFWEYEERGDFLDFSFDPPEIFGAQFKDDGIALEAHGLAGVEIPMSPSTYLMFESRYSFAEDKLGGDFSDLPERDIDLGGLSVYGGFSFRF